MLAMFAICPLMTSGCAMASNANAVHASSARISRLRKVRERGWSERRMTDRIASRPMILNLAVSEI